MNITVVGKVDTQKALKIVVDIMRNRELKEEKAS